MTNFSEIVDAADGLSIDEQVTLLEILRRRIAERNREQLLRDVREVRAEFAAGKAHVATVKDIIDEVRSEP